MAKNDRAAGAALSSWDGRITVDNSISAFCCSSRRRSPLNVEHYNGYAATSAQVEHTEADIVEKSKERECDPHYADDRDNYEEIISVSSTENILARKYDKNASGCRSSPNRSILSGTGGGGSGSRQPSSRLAASSRQTTMSSSLLGDSMTEIVIEDIPTSESEPTSALLDYCKRKFLKPYVMILSLVGLSPISTETTLCRTCLSYMLDVLLLSLLLFSYFLQYLTSYRGDRGFSNYSKSARSSSRLFGESVEGSGRTIGELLFGYIIPNALHLLSFITAVFVNRIAENEQLQNLIERVFLMSMKPRRLSWMLWLYVALGFGLLCLLLAYVTPSILMQAQITQVKWLGSTLNNTQIGTKIFLLCAIFVQDCVEIIILTNYCIECYLLRVHLATLSHKLLMHSIDNLDWMREILEFRKLLDHLNQRVGLPVCFLIVMNLSYAFAGIVYLFDDFDFQYSELKVVILNIINVLLWLVMGFIPFFMAASVTRVCKIAQANGHQIRVRPFVYHNTSSEDLNSTLLFAASLDMSAKLFRMPIQPNYLCFAILVVSLVILTLGMCLNLSVLGTI